LGVETAPRLTRTGSPGKSMMVEILPIGWIVGIATGRFGATSAGRLVGRRLVKRQLTRPAHTQRTTSELAKTIAPPRRVISRILAVRRWSWAEPPVSRPS
jgi:hypothetical protein